MPRRPRRWGHDAHAYWLVRPLRWVWAVPLLALAIEDVALGNITWLLALLAVAGLRVSSAWVPAAYVKVVSGLGVLWHAGRREWRPLALAFGVGLAVLAVSYGPSYAGCSTFPRRRAPSPGVRPGR